MQKNVAGQKLIVFAFDETDNTPVTGDAANITAKLSLDGAAAGATNDTNPTEIEDGYYAFDLTQAETDADIILALPESATANVQVIGVPAVTTTVPADFADATLATGSALATVGGNVSTILGRVVGTLLAGNHNPQTGDSYARIGANGAGLTVLATAAAIASLNNLSASDVAGELATYDAATGPEAAAIASAIAALNDLDAAGVRTAVGLAAANLDTQIGTLATAANLATLAAKVIGTIAAGTHNPQSGDAYGLIGATGSGLTSLASAANLATLAARIVGTLAAGTHEPQSGDAFARIGANGAGLSALELSGAAAAAIAAARRPSIRKNVADQSFPIIMVSATTGEPLAGLTVAMTVSKDSAAPAAAAGTVTGVGSGVYKVEPAQADTNAIDLVFLFNGGASAVVLPLYVRTDP